MPVRITKKPQSIAVPPTDQWPFKDVVVDPPLATPASEPLPWEDDPSDVQAAPVEQTLLQALAEFRPKGKRKLWLVHKVTGIEYQVKDWDDQTKRVKLVGPNHAKLNPVVGPREDPKYQPVWR